MHALFPVGAEIEEAKRVAAHEHEVQQRAKLLGAHLAPARGGSPTTAANFTGLVLGCIETKFCK